MRLTEIWISQHRCLSDVRVQLSNTDESDLLQSIYGKLAITLIAGPNGAGKTSLLSFAIQVFHNLERYPDRIRGAFSITYSIQDAGQWHSCVLSRNLHQGPVTFSLNGGLRRPIAKWRNSPRKMLDIGSVEYADVKRYLPSKIIVSAFSLHGEYPMARPSNYVGDTRVVVYDIKNLYGINHFGFPSFSGAISKLMKMVRQRAEGVQKLSELLHGEFTGRVLVRERSDVLVVDSDSDWEEFTEDLERREQAHEIYLNDFELSTKNGTLTLANMSSGQKMLLIRLLSVLSEIEDGSLIVVEEPELHLDPAWTRQLIGLLLLFFKGFNAHLLAATHSFSLLNAVPNNCMLVANSGTFSRPTQPTLLGNEAWLAHVLFSSRQNIVEEHVLNWASTASPDELRELLGRLGESSIRYDVFMMLAEMERGENLA